LNGENVKRAILINRRVAKLLLGSFIGLIIDGVLLRASSRLRLEAVVDRTANSPVTRL
jgi:hypothetical protein